MIDVLSDLFILRGIPGHIRSDNGPEFVAKAMRQWIAAVDAKTAYIEPGSTWENGYVESCNARLRDELLDGEIFYTLREAQIVIESWRRHFNAIRPHESLGYKPPASEVFVQAFAAWPAALRQPAPPATLPLAQRPTLKRTFRPVHGVGADQNRHDGATTESESTSRKVLDHLPGATDQLAQEKLQPQHRSWGFFVRRWAGL